MRPFFSVGQLLDVFVYIKEDCNGRCLFLSSEWITVPRDRGVPGE